ncbi:unnamed protein product [Rhodiola kirilowii]
MLLDIYHCSILYQAAAQIEIYLVFAMSQVMPFPSAYLLPQSLLF